MDHKRFFLCSATALFALAAACSKSPETPVAPSSSADVGASAVPSDGLTLKVTAPVPVSPVNNAQPDGSIVLVASKAQGKFTSVSPLYEFEVKNSGGAVVYSRVTGGVGSGPNNVEHTVEGALEFDSTHTWRVRAASPAARRPWSATANFRAPSGGYIRDNEVFDPLTNGRTVGEIVGPVTFIPGVGVRLEDFTSHIRYRLPRTMVTGEFSMIITGMATNTEGARRKCSRCPKGCRI